MQLKLLKEYNSKEIQDAAKVLFDNCFDGNVEMERVSITETMNKTMKYIDDNEKILNHERKIIIGWLTNVYLSWRYIEIEWWVEMSFIIRKLIVICLILEREYTIRILKKEVNPIHIPPCLIALYDILDRNKERFKKIKIRFIDLLEEHSKLFRYYIGTTDEQEEKK